MTFPKAWCGRLSALAALAAFTAVLSRPAGAQTPPLTLETTSVSPACPTAGGTLTYTLTVTNNTGNTTPPTNTSYTNVEVVDILPPGTTFSSASAGCLLQKCGQMVTCRLGSLGTSESKQVTITVQAPTAGTATNGAAAAAFDGSDTVVATALPPDTLTTVFSAAPFVTGLDRTSGPVAGGTEVKISGAGFCQDATVRFGTASATVTGVTQTQITVLSPPGSGQVTVSVTTREQTLTAGSFLYTQPCTSFTISPSSASPDASAGSRTVAVQGVPSGCDGTWSASGNGSWITASKDSATSATVAWSQNTLTSSRSGTATIASNAFAVTQAGVVPVAGSSGVVCVGQTLQLTASTIAGATYSWTGPNSFTSTLQNPSIPSVTLAATGTYSVTATVGGVVSAPGTTSAVVVPPGATTLSNQTITTTETYTSCSTLTLGPAFRVQSPGDVSAQPITAVFLTNGFSVGNGASFKARLYP